VIWNIRGWKTAMDFSDLRNGRITDNIYRFQNWGGKNAQDAPERVATGDRCRGSVIEVARREMVDFDTLEATELDVLDDGGVRRRYLGSAAAAGTVLNLTPANTAKLTKARRGDIAVDDGTNTKSGKPGLAVFDGKTWQTMN
jgi:hypothetical protein